jgi:hypothetical protein
MSNKLLLLYREINSGLAWRFRLWLTLVGRAGATIFSGVSRVGAYTCGAPKEYMGTNGDKKSNKINKK